MRCGVCDTRKARRACPALGRTICPVCCGSKRLTEIACPPDCGWLRVAATHPPAAQQRQVEEDQQRLRELLAGLSEPEYVVLTSCLRAALTHRRTAVPSPHDGDLREAAGALRARRSRPKRAASSTNTGRSRSSPHGWPTPSATRSGSSRRTGSRGSACMPSRRCAASSVRPSDRARDRRPRPRSSTSSSGRCARGRGRPGPPTHWRLLPWPNSGGASRRADFTGPSC